MSDTVKKFEAGDNYTGHAAAAVIGGRMVANSAAPQADGTITVNVPAAGAAVFAVAAFDAAIGAKVTLLSPGGLVPIEAGEALAWGTHVQTDNLGRAITLAAGIRCGRVVKAASGAGVKALVDFRPAFA